MKFLQPKRRVGFLSRRLPMRQRVLPFVDRARRLERTFKLVIAVATIVMIAIA